MGEDWLLLGCECYHGPLPWWILVSRWSLGTVEAGCWEVVVVYYHGPLPCWILVYGWSLGTVGIGVLPWTVTMVDLSIWVEFGYC